MKKILCLMPIAAALVFIACNGHTDTRSSVPGADSSGTGKHVELGAITDSSKLVIINRENQQLTYDAYKKSFEPVSPSMQPSFALKDIDGDGNNELIVDYYTGGAHCCQVTAILNRTGENEMREVLNYTGGTVISKDTVSLDFYEALGYFHTCYACGLEHPQPVSPVAGFIYKNGTFSFLPVNEQINSAILTNLKFIKDRGIPAKDSPGDDGFDDGTRKEIAINLTAWYFNNGRDIAKTKKLFEEYYNHQDKEKIWKDLAGYLQDFDQSISKGVAM